jgi:hypothetical protein
MIIIYNLLSYQPCPHYRFTMDAYEFRTFPRFTLQFWQPYWEAAEKLNKGRHHIRQQMLVSCLSFDILWLVR